MLHSLRTLTKYDLLCGAERAVAAALYIVRSTAVQAVPHTAGIRNAGQRVHHHQASGRLPSSLSQGGGGVSCLLARGRGCRWQFKSGKDSVGGYLACCMGQLVAGKKLCELHGVATNTAKDEYGCFMLVLHCLATRYFVLTATIVQLSCIPRSKLA